ncbi:lamin tail domain-containing protein [Leifsonia sp. 2TAF2]|uniref:lamin tail domain-containing protein n=1 Tax=Leifsonia sp. 2TAF2 TaxID=3233009 RepID=UPI003F9B4E12
MRIHSTARPRIWAALAAVGLCATAALAAAVPATAATADAAAATAAVTAAADPSIVINEVESSAPNGGPDWVELKNTGATAADLAGWSVLDNDDTHTRVPLPAGSIIPAGGYFVIDESTLGFGLGSGDSARLYDPAATLVDTYSWTSHAAVTYGRCPDGTGAFRNTTSSTQGAVNDCSVPAVQVTINEVESDGDATDWIELINNGGASADLGGYILRDDKDADAFVIPAGTSVAAGGYYTADVSALFGLGSADQARLFAPDGTTLVDSYAWTAHATATYGRCPNGTGAFATTSAPTKNAPNACPGDIQLGTWPGGTDIRTVDDANVLGGNMSGLYYEPSGTAATGVLWAVKNGPGTLYRLLWNGTVWTPDTANGWASGKALHYTDGTGDPDSEGVTITGAGPSGGIYVSTERNNSANTVSRPAILRFDPAQPGTSLTAAADWNLTPDLPVVGPNLGLEAVTWVPDAYLTSHGFVDQKTGHVYDPATYPGHGDGLFFAGLEANGNVYAYALGASGSYTRVATISTGMPGVMDLQFDPERQAIWAVCDDTCHGQHELLTVAASGANAGTFQVAQAFARPSGMPDYNNEGFALAPQAECVNGLKPAIWADDTADGGHALRQGTVACTVLPGGGNGGGGTGGGGNGGGTGGGGNGGGGNGGGTGGGGSPAAPTAQVSASSVGIGGKVTVSATGFAAGEQVEIWLHSDPVLLAVVTAGPTGAVTATVTIPSTVPAGAHALVLLGRTSGATVTVALTVTAIAAANGETAGLASTGSDVTVPLGAALLLGAVGSGLLLARGVARRRSA